MNREAVGDRAVLARAARAVRVLVEARRRRRDPGGLDRWMPCKMSLVELGALLDVGLHEDVAAVDEQPRHLVEERRAHHEALLVTLLPPRIREVEEERRHRTVRRKSRQCLTSVGVEDPRPPAEAVL